MFALLFGAYPCYVMAPLRVQRRQPRDDEICSDADKCRYGKRKQNSHEDLSRTQVWIEMVTHCVVVCPPAPGRVRACLTIARSRDIS
jgi:hypothetical protein